jgi:hypothetical protein
MGVLRYRSTIRNHGTRCQCHAPAPLPSGIFPVPILQEAVLDPGPVSIFSREDLPLLRIDTWSYRLWSITLLAGRIPQLKLYRNCI